MVFWGYEKLGRRFMKEPILAENIKNFLSEATTEELENSDVGSSDESVLQKGLAKILAELNVGSEVFIDKSNVGEFKKILKNCFIIEKNEIKLKTELEKFKTNLLSSTKKVETKPLSSDKSKPKRVLVRASGKNLSCAFHALILAIWDLIVQGKLDKANDEQKHRILELFSILDGFKGKDFDDLKDFLLRSDKKDLVKLEELQGEIARKKVLNILEAAEGKIQEYTDLTLPALLAAYDDYESKEKVGDDIFRRHKFVLDKFAELQILKPSNEQLKNQLTTWWNVGGGAQQFMTAMAQPGHMAGDIELGILAGYLGINVFVTRGDTLETSLLQNKDKINPDIPAVYLRNDALHWDYEAEDYPKWLESFIIKDVPKLSVPEDETHKSTRKWTILKTKNLLDKIFKTKVEKKDDDSFVVKHKENEINIARTGSAHEITTETKDAGTLREMVRAAAAMIDESNKEGKNLKRIISIEPPDAATKKILIEACKHHKLTVKGLDEKEKVEEKNVENVENHVRKIK